MNPRIEREGGEEAPLHPSLTKGGCVRGVGVTILITLRDSTYPHLDRTLGIPRAHLFGTVGFFGLDLQGDFPGGVMGELSRHVFRKVAKRSERVKGFFRFCGEVIFEGGRSHVVTPPSRVLRRSPPLRGAVLLFEEEEKFESFYIVV